MKKFPRMKKLLILILTLAVCLGLIELAARIFLGAGYPLNRSDPAVIREAILNKVFASRMFRRLNDSTLCYDLVPSGRAEIPGQVYTNNREGFRGPEIEREKPKDTFRIAVSGDSFVFGWGTDDRSTFPVLMEKILRKGGLDAAGYQVINGGVPGYNVAQMKERLLRKIFDFEPDVLVLVVSANDLTADTLHFDPFFQGLYEDFLPVPYSLKEPFWRLSVAYRYCAQRYKAYLKAAGKVGGFSDRDIQFFGEEVRAIEEEARRRGIGFLPVILPMLEDFTDYPYQKQHQDMHRALEGVAFADLLDQLQGYDVKDLWFLPDDHHLNRRANLAVARMILSLLDAQGLIHLRKDTLPEEPLAEALYQSGDLVVVDMDADPEGRGGFPGALFRLSPDGAELSLISADPAFIEPVDVVFDPVGNLLVLDNAADPSNLGSSGAVFRVNRFTGRAEPVVVSKQFALPNALLLDEDGRIFISEKQYDPLGLGEKTGCLMVYDPEKEKVEVLAAGSEFVSPGAIAFAPDDKLYFMDADSNPNNYTGRNGKPNTPGVLFEVDRQTGEFRSLIAFKDTVSPVGIVPLPDQNLIVIDANADVLEAGFWLGGLLMVDPVKGAYRFIHCSKKFVDPTRGDLGPDGCVYFTDSNADPLNLGPDRAGKGVQGTGPGAVWRYDYRKNELTLVYSGEELVNPISLKVVN